MGQYKCPLCNVSKLICQRDTMIKSIFSSFLPFKNVYGIIIMNLHLKLMGLAPFVVRKKQNGEDSVRNMNTAKYLPVIGTALLQIFYVTKVVMVKPKENQTLFSVFIGILVLFTSTFMISLISFNIRSKQLLKSLHYLHLTESLFQQLGIRTSAKLAYIYTLILRLIVYIILLVLLGYGLEVWREWFLFCQYAMEVLAYGYPIVVSTVFLYYFTSTVLLIHNRLSLLNNYIKSLNQEKFCPVQKYRKFAEIYSALCKSASNITHVMSVPILMYYILTFGQTSILAMNLAFSITEINFNILAWNILCIIILFWVLFCVEILEYQAKQTPFLLANFTASFYCEDLASLRNTNLMQMLHETIEVTICGCIRISISKTLEDIKLVSTLVVFVIQFKSS